MNNIYSLVEINTEDAQKAILQLSKLIRYMLYESELDNTLLSREIEFMKNYVKLLIIRLLDTYFMIKVLAIDDEPLALQLVTGYIKKTPFLELCGTFDNPITAMEFLERETVGLIFLDIQMPDLTSTEFARILNNGPRITFTTAYEKYALEGFRLDAVDYLLKPFGYDEFLVSAQKARKLIEVEQRAETVVEANAEFLFVKSDYKIRRINFYNILYIEGLKDYVKIFLLNESKPILSITK